jgi:hypothetical protein
MNGPPARREHFPLDASLLNELSFSNFPLLYSSQSGVLCHPTAGAEHRAFSFGAARLASEDDLAGRKRHAQSRDCGCRDLLAVLN